MGPPRTPDLAGSGSRQGRLLRPAVFLPALLVAALVLSAGFARLGLPGADEGALLTNAVKLLRGAVYYRDVDAYPFPLATYLLAGWMGAFGEHLGAARGLAALVYAVTVASLYACALPLLGARRAALFGLSLLAFKYLAWPSFTAYTYWDVAFACACLCAALLVAGDPRGSAARLAAAGAAAGLAVLAKQNLGLYLAGAVGAGLLLAGPLLGAGRAGARAGVRAAALFAAGAALPLAVAGAYFAGHGVLGRMLGSGLVRPFTGYLPTSAIPFSVPLAWWELGSLRGRAGEAYLCHRLWRLLSFGPLADRPVTGALWSAGEILARALYSSVPLAFLGAAVLWWRERWRGTAARDERLFRLAVIAGAVFLSALPRADQAHVVSVYPLVLLLLYALWARLAPRALALEAGVVALLLVACGWLLRVELPWHSHRVRLARADVWVRPEDAWVESVVRFVEAETAPEDGVFVYGQQADLYFLSGRRFAWPFAQLYPGQTGGEGGRELAELLRHEPPRLVIRGLMSWPGLPDLPSSVPLVDRWVNHRCEALPEVFERFPLPSGPAPVWWSIAVLRPCRQGQRCASFYDYTLRRPMPSG
jgi:hypothetical protein